MTNSPFVLDAGRVEEAFVDLFFYAGERTEVDPFHFGGKASGQVEEGYLNNEDSDELLYDFGPFGGGDV
mgnify:CR=1 FL=1